MDVREQRYESLKRMLSSLYSATIDQICTKASEYPEWQKGGHGSGGPLSTLKQEITAILQSNKIDFVNEDNRWRRRHEDACSFCLEENVSGCRGPGRFYGQGPIICAECAATVVETLREKKEKEDRVAAHELAILRGEEILGA